MPPRIDETGNTYTRLTVLNEAGLNSRGLYLWECLCSCGNIVVVAGSNLRSGHTRSCGCYLSDKNIERSTHGLAGTREYRIWSSIKRRCNNSKDKLYPRWGGVGIKMCESWENPSQYFWKIWENALPANIP